MDLQLIVLCGLTFIIHLVGTLAYAVRIAGVRTRRLAVSFAIFNILVLVSRTSNSFQGSFLAKRVEHGLVTPGVAGSAILSDIRWLLVSASVATLMGGVLVPTFQRLFSRAVSHFHVHRSIPRLFWDSLVKSGYSKVRATTKVPSAGNLKQLAGGAGLSTTVVVLNIVAVALWTVGVFASLYAGLVKPELRMTCISLSAMINGGATILLAVFIDPHLSALTDDVMEGRVSEGRFRRAITGLVGARLVGTIAAQFLLVPAAFLIARAAEFL